MVTEKPWGRYELLKNEDGFWVKILTIYPNCRFSLQYHKKRDEHWFVLSGKGCVCELSTAEPNSAEAQYPESYRLAENDTMTVMRGTLHRIWNHSEDEDLVICEIATGEPDENDIVRVSDDYGRS